MKIAELQDLVVALEQQAVNDPDIMSALRKRRQTFDTAGQPTMRGRMLTGLEIYFEMKIAALPIGVLAQEREQLIEHYRVARALADVSFPRTPRAAMPTSGVSISTVPASPRSDTGNQPDAATGTKPGSSAAGVTVDSDAAVGQRQPSMGPIADDRPRSSAGLVATELTNAPGGDQNQHPALEEHPEARAVMQTPDGILNIQGAEDEVVHPERALANPELTPEERQRALANYNILHPEADEPPALPDDRGETSVLLYGRKDAVVAEAKRRGLSTGGCIKQAIDHYMGWSEDPDHPYERRARFVDEKKVRDHIAAAVRKAANFITGWAAAAVPGILSGKAGQEDIPVADMLEAIKAEFSAFALVGHEIAHNLAKRNDFSENVAPPDLADMKQRADAFRDFGNATKSAIEAERHSSKSATDTIDELRQRIQEFAAFRAELIQATNKLFNGPQL